MTQRPLILWFRRDLRLSDHPMLAAATGRMVLPLFILDPETESLGAAPKWRLGLSIADFAARLEALGSRLTLRRGRAVDVLTALIAETGAGAVWWQRLYDPAAMARDAEVKSMLRAAGHEARSHAGHLLHEPWEVETGQGGSYKVYTPFWKALSQLDISLPFMAPTALIPPKNFPFSDNLVDWSLGRGLQRGAAVLRPHQQVGEAAALARLDRFLDGPIEAYKERRDFPAEDATSGLSENLAWGEIGPRTIWAAGNRARHEGRRGAEHFLKELVWREFAYHLMYHSPQILSRNWRQSWDAFPWRADNPDAERWRRGMTGEPMVDAAMREMYVTGRMNNRARMLAASYLTKHLLTDWRVGQEWFAECLTDWDPAANAMGWQWVAGSGPDAAPYFRIFNPAGQGEKFDAEGRYQRRFVAEIAPRPEALALRYFEAVPKAWGLDPNAPYPMPLIALSDGRERALSALSAMKLLSETQS